MIPSISLREQAPLSHQHGVTFALWPIAIERGVVIPYVTANF